MLNIPNRRAASRIARGLLRLRVHLDALAAEPGAYLQGVVWRIRGLKLRSRHRFSALMRHSAHAYELWMASREPGRLEAIARAEHGGLQIALVVDCRESRSGLPQTLASIATLALSTSPDGDAVELALLGDDGPGGRRHARLANPAALSDWLRDLAQRSRNATPWVIAINAGDRLAPLALSAYRTAVGQTPGATLFYADDDLIGSSDKRHAPHFKPGWNPELFRHFDFVTNSSMFACEPAAVDTGWPRTALPLADNPLAVGPVHIPHVLHHRRARPLPVRPALPAEPAALPHVSVIVPTRDHVALLRTCLEGLAVTRYPSLDVTVIDNDSRDPETLAYLLNVERDGVRVERYAKPFNYAAMHNAVVPSISGPLVCLLNNDIEIVDPDWLRIMATDALRDDVGAVGPRLLYPDGTIQHAGIVIGVGGGAGHAHRLQRDDAAGYFGRAHLPQFVSAVTAACLLVRKDRFMAVGGFDAENFAVAFNDVDFCLKLNARGWQSFYEPRACLVHHESKSRGRDDQGRKKARFDGELAALKRIWSTNRGHDRYHHPELSQFGEQFVVRL
jgi:O-antigen biosynthesis protein